MTSSSNATKISFSDSDKLIGAQNYTIWAFHVEQILREKDLWYVVDPSLNNSQISTGSSVGGSSSTNSGSSSTGGTGVVTGTTATTVPNQKHLERVIIILTKTVTASIFPIVSRLRADPNKLWATLKKKFESSAIQRKLDLKTALIELRMFEGASVEEYLKKVDHHVMELASIGEEIPEKELIQIVLRSLPDSWSSFKSVYGVMYSKDTQATFADLEEYLQAEEFRRKPRTESGEQSLLAMSSTQRYNSGRSARGGRGRGRFNRWANRRDQGRGPPGDRRGGDTCNYCGKRGHWEPDCFEKIAHSEIKSMTVAQMRELTQSIKEIKGLGSKSYLAIQGDIGDSGSDKNDSSNEQQSVLTVEAMLTEHEENRSNSQTWILDSGASTHISRDKSSFTSLSDNSATSNVLTASGSGMPVSGSGCISLSKNKTISDVLYVPSITRNLLSIGKLTDQGHSVVFNSKYCYITDNRHPHGFSITGTRDPASKLYKIQVPATASKVILPNQARTCLIVHPKISAQCHLTTASMTTQHLWHQRLGHSSSQRVSHMTRNQLIVGAPVLPSSQTMCEVCMKGKQTRQRIPKAATFRATRPLELVHSDLCGPLPVPSLTGARYVITFTDDYSRFTWVYFLKFKSEALDKFKLFKSQVENMLQQKLACLRSDRGGEYTSELFRSFCHTHGITRQLTVARTPHQNGVAERKNRTLFELARTISFDSKAPANLWEELVRTANYINNRCSTRALNLSTPFECLTRVKPNVSHFRIIGSTAYVHIPKEMRDKLGSKSLKCVLVGYDDQSKAYRCFDPLNRRILISRDVIIDEHSPGDFSITMATPKESLFDMFSFFDTSTSTTDGSNPVSTGNAPESADLPHDQLDAEASLDDSLDNQDVPDIPESNSSPTPARHVRRARHRELQRTRPQSGRLTSLPYKLSDFHVSLSAEQQETCLALLADSTNHISLNDALADPSWIAAMQQELNAHDKNGTWELVALPEGEKALSARWVLRTKVDHAGHIKYKARVVARGNEQREGLDYEETFAPVVRWSTVRLIVALATANGWPIHHMDVVTAFLNSTLKETIFMRQPPGFVMSGQENLVCKLRKSIYGLKQSPRAWYEEVDNYLRSIGCTRSSLDPNLYFRQQSGETVIILLFVDDLLITGSKPKLLSEIKDQLQSKYEMKDLGTTKRYLGVDFHFSKQGTLLHQKFYADQLVTEYGMENCRTVFTPLPEGLELSSETNTPDIDVTTYCKLVGKLIYLTNTRPDLSFSVGLVSRFMSRPQQAHFDAAMHIVRYVKGTTGLGVFYNRGGSLDLKGYTDSDWGNSCPDTRRSTGGYIYMLAGGPITWSSKRQPTISRSTTEAEYRALSDGAQEGVYLKRLIEELQHCRMASTEVKFKNQEISDNLKYAAVPTIQDLHVSCDSMSAIKLAKNPVFHARTKHLEIHHHFIRERVLANEIVIQHVKSEDQLADTLTKVLPRLKFDNNRHRIGMKFLAQSEPSDLLSI